MPSISKINMKKTISLNKKLEFPTMIGEVTAISLEHTLNFLDESNIIGNLIIFGRYKMTEASRLEEDFNYKIPIEIILTEKIDIKTAKVDIEDFYYEIEDDDTMICYIDVKVEGVEIIEDEKAEIVEELPAIIENNLNKENISAEEKSSYHNLKISNNEAQNQNLEKFILNDNLIRECDSEKNSEQKNDIVLNTEDFPKNKQIQVHHNKKKQKMLGHYFLHSKIVMRLFQHIQFIFYVMRKQLKQS